MCSAGREGIVDTCIVDSDRQMCKVYQSLTQAMKDVLYLCDCLDALWIQFLLSKRHWEICDDDVLQIVSLTQE
jgi:hypothetical protein